MRRSELFFHLLTLYVSSGPVCTRSVARVFWGEEMKRLVMLFLFAAAMVVAQPVVNSGGILNVASYAPPGLPNSSIAQGSLFAIFGTGLGPTPGAAVYAFPLTPNGFQGTTVTVTVNGTTVKAPVLFTSANQINAMLPSATPVGSGTLSVTYNNQTSASVSIDVVAHSFGAFAVSQAGSGPAVITNANYQPLSFTFAANPGEPMILWGTGLGPVTGDENAGPLPGNMPSLPVKVYVGNQQVQVSYQGRSGCCSGVDQIVFNVPANVTGCAVPVAVQIGTTVSNYTTMPIASSGRVCSDNSIFSSTLFSQLSSKQNAAVGSVLLMRDISTGTLPPPLGNGTPTTTTTDDASADFSRYNYTSLQQYVSYLPVQTYGACSVLILSGNGSNATGPKAQSTPLDAGASLSMNGPGGAAQIALISKGVYDSTVGGGAGTTPKPLYYTPGSYTVNGPGGVDVGSFQASVQFPASFTWTNQSSITSVNRSQGVTVSWTGADSTNGVFVTGFSLGGTDVNNLVGGVFYCHASGASGSFTVPPVVLLALPPSYTIPGFPLATGLLAVTSMAPYQTFSASGLDFGYIESTVQAGESLAYQ
jgi:uncharacterized protein (TIGR03437 family)